MRHEEESHDFGIYDEISHCPPGLARQTFEMTISLNKIYTS